MRNGKTNYDKYPETNVPGYEGTSYPDAASISAFFAERGKKKDDVLVVETYPGVKDDEILPLIQNAYHPDVLILSEDMFYDTDVMDDRMQPFLTDDRVRGVMYYGLMEDYVDESHLNALKAKANAKGKVLIYGVGASMIRKGNLLVYCDMARWEVELRYRRGMPNFHTHNEDEDSLKKIKRGYFVEWRIADKQKMKIFSDVDYFLDSNVEGSPKMVTGDAVREGLKLTSEKPFRLVPYFDPGVWGGQWMKKVCGLDPDKENYAWAFDGVPEENSLYLRIDGNRVEIPAMDLVLSYPVELLGMKNYCRFGAEFPIRFDFLDTMDGQNLSLQVHPMTEYIKSHYGMTYTQDESYYLLDAGDDASVYLGLKDGVDPKEFEKDLYAAQEGKYPFPAEKYVNRFPAKKHDHFLIPAGTIHCSGANAMVLEVSATPYNFTFKLWDWDRLGLDGKPRPIHIADGMKNIQWNRTTEWVKKNLVNHIEVLHDGEDYKEERTGLHELEFIETRRFTSKGKTTHHCGEGFHMCNLVDGSEAVIESPDDSFEPFVVHYAETFILPASVKEYTIRPVHENEEIKVLQAYVRQR